MGGRRTDAHPATHLCEWLGRSLQAEIEDARATLQQRHASWPEEIATLESGEESEWLRAKLEAERDAIHEQLQNLMRRLLQSLESLQCLQEPAPHGSFAIQEMLDDGTSSADLRRLALCSWGPPTDATVSPSPPTVSAPELPRASKVSHSEVKLVDDDAAEDVLHLPGSVFSRDMTPPEVPDLPAGLAKRQVSAELEDIEPGAQDAALPRMGASKEANGERCSLGSLSTEASEAVQAPPTGVPAETRRPSFRSSGTQDLTKHLGGNSRPSFRTSGTQDLARHLGGSAMGASSSITSRISNRMRRMSSRGDVGQSEKEEEDEETDSEALGYCWLLEEVVAHPMFESTFAALIMVNSLIMALEAQYSGIQWGYEISYPGSVRSAEDAWPLAVQTFAALEWIFAACFSLELLIKVSGKRLDFFRDHWNILDTVIVLSWFVQTLSSASLPFPPMLLRLARLVKLLRLLRLVRKLQTFDSLYVMTTAIKGSAWALLWSTALLCVVQMMLALWLNQMVESFILDESRPLEMRQEVYQYYGSFTRAVMTMFELTLANWIDPARVIFENVSEWYILFVLSHQLIIGFAMVRVITGVFLHETFKVASSDDTIMVAEKERAIAMHTTKMNKILERADANFDGLIDKEEFAQIISDPWVKTWLSAVGLDVRDANTVYTLVDDEGVGQITPERLVQGVARLKGPARSIDVLVLLKEVAEMKESIEQLMQVLREKGDDLVLQDWFSLSSSSCCEDHRAEDTEPNSPQPQVGGDVAQSASQRSKGRRKGRQATSQGRSAIRGLLEKRAAGCTVAKPAEQGLHLTLDRIVGSHWFELFFIGLIVANAVVMCFEAQYAGINTGFRIGYRTTTQPAHEVLPGADVAFEVFEWFFGVMFATELVLKLAAMKADFFKRSAGGIWNVFDSIIVIFWFVARLDAVSLPLDPLLLRVARLMRLLRLLRLVRAIRGFDSLYLMVTALKSSCLALTWSVVLLVVVQMLLALILHELLEPYIIGTGREQEMQHKVYQYFGTFSRSMLTMFEITLANWAPVCRLLAENVSEFYVIFSLAHKIIIGFAVVTVINGVFMQQTFKVAATDDTIMTMQQTRATEMHRKKMDLLFKAADEDGNGMLDQEEFQHIMGESAVRTWLAAMELQVDDVGAIFQLVSSGEEGISADELVRGVAKLKGQARSLDLHLLIQDHKMLMAQVQHIAAALNK